MGVLVICSYKPKPGREAAMKALVSRHLPTLRAAGLVTEREGAVGESADGAIVELFEWASAEKSRNALAVPSVAALWKEMSEASDFVPLASLKEAQRAFAHFTPLA